MGKRGPKPKPSALKKLEGTYRKDRVPKNEMVLPPGTPKMPPWLSKEAKKEWQRITPQLAELGVLTDCDGTALANYCEAVSVAITATRQYQKEGMTVQGSQGTVAHPAVRIAQLARAQVKQYAEQFGLTPSSRSRVNVPDKLPTTSGDKKASGDPAEQFFFNPPKLVVNK